MISVYDVKSDIYFVLQIYLPFKIENGTADRETFERKS